MTSDGLSRRSFFGAAAVASAGTVLAAPAAGATTPVTEAAGEKLTVAMKVNGVRRELTVDPRVTLLDALRERLDLTGTKKGCDRG